MNRGSRVPAAHRWRRQSFLDVVLALVLLALVETTILTKSGHGRHPIWWPEVILGVVAILPLAWRHRAPLAVLIVTGGATLVAMVHQGSPGLLALGPLVALYTVATTSQRSVSIGAAVITLMGVVIGVAIGREDRATWEAFVFPVAVIAATWLIGDNLRVRRAYVAELEAKAVRADADRVAEAAAAASEERSRIARELHDVVIHHVSVIAVQAGAARLLADDESTAAETRDALAAVEATARQALSELRQLLGVLRHTDDPVVLAPTPGLEQLEGLLEEVRRAGLPVEARIEGEPVPLPAALELSAYRIVQEALTNVLKHEGPVPTSVVVRYGPTDLGIEVIDEGTCTPSAVSPASGGHGLIGMRERVDLLGGQLKVGPRREGGFAVSARFPLVGSAQ